MTPEEAAAKQLVSIQKKYAAADEAVKDFEKTSKLHKKRDKYFALLNTALRVLKEVCNHEVVHETSIMHDDTLGNRTVGSSDEVYCLRCKRHLLSSKQWGSQPVQHNWHAIPPYVTDTRAPRPFVGRRVYFAGWNTSKEERDDLYKGLLDRRFNTTGELLEAITLAKGELR